MIRTYYRSGDSATATYRALKVDYALHKRPTTQAIGKIMKKFKEPIVVTNIERPVRHRFARFAENISVVTTVTANSSMVTDFFLSVVEDYELENMWFQQDGVTCYTTWENTALL